MNRTERWWIAALAAVAAACAADRGRDELTLTVATRAGFREARLEERVLDRFARGRSGIRVLQQTTRSRTEQYRERILTSMTVGAPPDAFLLDHIDVSALTRGGLVLDLAPYLPRLGVDLARYQPTAVAIFRRREAVYAVPKGYTPMVVAYNKDLLDRAGIPYPAEDWVWDDFLRIAKQLTRDTDGDGHVDQWGTSFDREVSFWIPWIWSGGGDVLCADGRRASGCLDAPATVEAIRWYSGWVTRDSVARGGHGMGRTPGDRLALLYTGRVAMVTADHSLVPGLLPYVRDRRLRVGFAPIPHRVASPPATVIYASGYAVAAGAPHRRLSVELATFLADSTAQTVRGADGFELPSLVSLAESVAVRDTLGWERVFLRAAAHGRVPWSARVERWHGIEPALAAMMDRITREGTDPRLAARATAAELDRLLAPATP